MITEASAKATASASAGASPRLARRAPHSAAASPHRCDRCSRGSHPRSLRSLPSSSPTLPLTRLAWCPTAAAFPAQVLHCGRYSAPPPLRLAFLQLHPELCPHWSFSFARCVFPTSGVPGSTSCRRGEPLRRWSVWGNGKLSRLGRAEVGVEGWGLRAP